MDFIEMAKIRMEHWITHNEHHQKEYATFIEQLQGAGKQDCADHIREMMILMEKSSHCLREALNALEE